MKLFDSYLASALAVSALAVLIVVPMLTDELRQGAYSAVGCFALLGLSRILANVSR